MNFEIMINTQSQNKKLVQILRIEKDLRNEFQYIYIYI